MWLLIRWQSINPAESRRFIITDIYIYAIPSMRQGEELNHVGRDASWRPARGQWHVDEQAEAGGACSSEHCSCWSHAELCPSILRGVHPWDPLARPSVHRCGGHVATVRQRLRPMSPALGRDQWQPTGDCQDHRRAVHRSHIYIYRPSFYYFTEVVYVYPPFIVESPAGFISQSPINKQHLTHVRARSENPQPAPCSTV